MKMKQKMIKSILELFGGIYLLIERHMEYPNDEVIMGLKIDSELQNMSRKQLCKYMDRVSGGTGFYDLSSTTKIRYGCQLLRNFTKHGEIKDDYKNGQVSDYI